MSELNADRSLLDASLELFNLIGKSHVLIWLLSNDDMRDAYQDRIDTLKRVIGETAPPVIETISKNKHAFAQVSQPVRIETKPAYTINKPQFYPPVNRFKQYGIEPGPIIGTSYHHAGVYHLESQCLKSDFWSGGNDDMFVDLPPVFDEYELLVPIEWERYKVFGKDAVEYKSPGDRKYSNHELEKIFKTGRKSIENRLNEIGVSIKGPHTSGVVRKLANYLCGRNKLRPETRARATEIMELPPEDSSKILNFLFE